MIPYHNCIIFTGDELKNANCSPQYIPHNDLNDFSTQIAKYLAANYSEYKGKKLPNKYFGKHGSIEYEYGDFKLNIYYFMIPSMDTDVYQNLIGKFLNKNRHPNLSSVIQGPVIIKKECIISHNHVQCDKIKETDISIIYQLLFDEFTPNVFVRTYLYIYKYISWILTGT